MSVLQNIVNSIQGARKKLAHAISVIKLAEGKIAHFKTDRQTAKKGSPRWTRDNRKIKYWTGVLKRAIQARDGWKLALKRRIAKKAAYLKAHPSPSPTGTGFVTVDGRPVPKWIAAELARARASGHWKGAVVSGYRTPEYSRQLCHGICGRDSCPGLCAGVTSNHTCPPTFTGRPYEGAVDVTDYAGLRAWCEAHSTTLTGGGKYLPSDPVHFSHTGR